jgi:hypothetical protein
MKLINIKHKKIIDESEQYLQNLNTYKTFFFKKPSIQKWLNKQNKKNHRGGILTVRKY